METNIGRLEQRINAENRWTNTYNYFQLQASKRNPTLSSLNEEITRHLQEIEHVNPDISIDWEHEQEISEFAFREFGYTKLTHTLAYSSELMSWDKAVGYLTEFIEIFGPDKRFFTNYDDLEHIIENFGTIVAYESKDGGYSYGLADISENTFDCALIIVDSKHVGSIIMRDED